MMKTDAEISKEAFRMFWDAIWCPDADIDVTIGDKKAEVVQHIRNEIQPQIRAEFVQLILSDLAVKMETTHDRSNREHFEFAYTYFRERFA